MTRPPTSLEIRSFWVGFGDCFLLSFVYGTASRRHVLIDFGTTALKPKKKDDSTAAAPTKALDLRPSIHMPKVAEEIRKVCAEAAVDSFLAALVATHRHADHISGFATDGSSGHSGEVIAALRPRVVIQPWTEDPKAARDATSATPNSRRSRKNFVRGLAAMNRIAQDAVHVVTGGRGKQFSAVARGQIEFLGMDNITNRSAIENLQAMGRKPGRAVYARYGDDLGLSDLLPGVRVTVLGPPDLTQTESIRKQRDRDPDQFWHLTDLGPEALTRSASRGRRRVRTVPLPPEARWFRGRLDRIQRSSMLQIVRSLDERMNNTSLILLFEVGHRKLLFPGDAQAENWLWALQGAPEAAANRKLLADVDVYKVGHHGSLNATPRILWNGFVKRGTQPGRRMRSFLSTLARVHGTAASKTEVPRETLKAALLAETDLNNTEDYAKDVLPNGPVVIDLT